MDLHQRAKQLRKTMTRQEVRLWSQLKEFNRECASHFRRQAVIDNCIVDFADFDARMLIEVDGGQHGEPTGEQRDERRDARFQAAGFVTLRFWNHEINESLDGVCDVILETLFQRKGTGPKRRMAKKGKAPSVALARDTSPEMGEDQEGQDRKI